MICVIPYIRLKEKEYTKPINTGNKKANSVIIVGNKTSKTITKQPQRFFLFKDVNRNILRNKNRQLIKSK